MAKQPETVPMPGKRKAPPEAAVRELEAAAEARQAMPAGTETASLQARHSAQRQAVEAAAPVAKPAPADDGGGRSVQRKRGAWTKDEPYTRKDGTATRGTTIYLPVELAERLRRFAFEQDRKQNAIITDAIEAYLLRRDA